MYSKLLTTISSRTRVSCSRRHFAIGIPHRATAMKDASFLIQSATTQKDYEFLSKIIKEEQRCVGVHMVTHVGPIIKPGFFIGYLNGQRIGCISACKYGKGNAADGLFYSGLYAIIKPFRGKGYGSKLTRAMFNLGKECNIGFNSFINMISTYERITGTCDKSLHREYVLPCSSIVQSILKEETSSAKLDVTQIKPIDSSDFSKLLTYDASVFGFLRETFLKAWITIPESMGLVATNKNGNITGYAVMQPSVIDEKEEQIIGPLFSDNDHVTQLLLYTLAKAAIDRKGSSMLRLTVPVEFNPSVAELIEKEMGCTTFFEYMRMYTKGFPPHASFKKIVAINSSAFG